MNPQTMLRLLLGAALLVVAAGADAQATRTFVSGVGDDANPCSRTAPCRTFAGAISKTAAKGEINCLDPGGFGAVTITKSIAILCEGATGGVLVSGSNGIVVNAAGVDVYLKGLDLNGIGTGLSGVVFLQGASLHVDQCLIRNFNSSTALGIRFVPSTAGILTVTGSTISNNGISGGAGGGILIQPAAGGFADVTIEQSNVINNLAFGIKADGTGSTGGVVASITNSTVAGNAGTGILASTPGGGAPVSVMVSDTSASDNARGLQTVGAVNMRIGGSTVAHNAIGVSIGAGSTMNSYGNNQITDNATPGPPIPLIPLQ